MMYVIKWNDKEEWNTQVHSFKDWDVYFLCEYAVSLMLHGDGFPYLFLFEDSKMRMAYVMMLNDLSDIEIAAEGIHYLKENSGMENVKKYLLDHVEMISTLINIVSL